MSVIDLANQSLAQIQSCTPLDNGVAVRTHCLYPSNAAVIVFIRGDRGRYVVMDDGRAFSEAEAAGAHFSKSIKRYQRFASRQGLQFKDGIVKTPEIGAEMIPTAILLVANASKELAEELFGTWRPSSKKDFKEAVRALVRRELIHLRVKEEKIPGTSNKSHHFDNVVHLAGDRRVIIDPVLRDANSINSRVVAHIDLRAAQHRNLDQRIVYDDSDRWTSDDLSLLQVSNVPIVPFSKVSMLVEGLRAA